MSDVAAARLNSELPESSGGDEGNAHASEAEQPPPPPQEQQPQTSSTAITAAVVAAQTAVERFLEDHNLAEYSPAMRNEGYDDVEDLHELVLNHNKDLLEKLMPKPGHRAKLSRILSTHRRGFGFVPSSRSTALGDTDDEAMSITDSIVSYQSRAPLPSSTAYVHHQQQQQQQQHMVLAAGHSASTSSLPHVRSYHNNDSLDHPASSHLGMSATSGDGLDYLTAGSVAATPSPSPQRTDLLLLANAPLKAYLDASNQPISSGGRPVATTLQAVSPAVPQSAARTPLRSPRSSSTHVAGGGNSSMRRSPSGHMLLGSNHDEIVSCASFIPAPVGGGPSNSSFVGSSTQFQPQVQQQQQQVKMKVVVVGQPGCGKTSLIHRLVKNEFSDNFKSTIGVEFAEKKFQVGSTVVSLHFWDIWGQESTVNATRTYYLGAKGAVVVYDSTKEESLNKAILWKRDLDAKARVQANGLPIPVILVGNKYDLTTSSGGGGGGGAGGGGNGASPTTTSSGLTSFSKQRGPSTAAAMDKLLDANQNTVLKTKDEIQAFCNEHKFAGHFFTSAKTGESVRAVAEYLVLAVLKMDPLENPGERDARVVTFEPSHGGSNAGSNRSLARDGSPRRSKSGDDTSKGGQQKKRRCTML